MTRFLPPSKLVECNVERSMIGDGCVIRHGTSVTGSMVGLRSLIGSNCTIDEALIMGADYYETLEECALVPECIPMGIGSNTSARGAGGNLWLASCMARSCLVQSSCHRSTCSERFCRAQSS